MSVSGYVSNNPASQARDTFTRNTVDGWGSATQGGAWTLDAGAAADFDVGGTEGTVDNPVVNTQHRAVLPLLLDGVDVTVKWQSNKVAAGGEQRTYVIARRVSASLYYFLRIGFAVNASLKLQLGRDTTTLIGSEVVLSAAQGTHAADRWFHARLQVFGTTPTTLRARVWEDGSPEPEEWQVEATDSTSALQAAGGVGLGAMLVAATSNAPVLFTFDDFDVIPMGTPLLVVTQGGTAPAPIELTLRWIDQLSQGLRVIIGRRSVHTPTGIIRTGSPWLTTLTPGIDTTLVTESVPTGKWSGDDYYQKTFATTIGWSALGSGTKEDLPPGRWRVFVPVAKTVATDDISLRLLWGPTTATTENDAFRLDPDDYKTTGVVLPDLGVVTIPGSVVDDLYLEIHARRDAGTGNLRLDLPLFVPLEEYAVIEIPPLPVERWDGDEAIELVSGATTAEGIAICDAVAEEARYADRVGGTPGGSPAP